MLPAQNHQVIFRSRLKYACCGLIVICMGLLSRSNHANLPKFIVTYAGDALWALTAFLGVGFLFPSLSPWRVSALTAAFSGIIEVSQLYHQPWLDAVRHTFMGALVLGKGFLWSDLLCYAAGISIGLFAELTIGRRERRT
jgi:hypothetical protein